MATEEATTSDLPATDLPDTPPQETVSPIADTSSMFGDAAQAFAVPSAQQPSMDLPMAEMKEYGFADESVKQYEFELYKGRKGQTDRLGLLRDTGPLGARVHFKEGIGYFVCLSEFKSMETSPGKFVDSPVRIAVCCKACEGARKRFVIPIIRYGTDASGRMLKELSYQLMAWVYTDDKFIMMRTLNQEFPLNKHDVLVTCTEESYQKLTIQACKESLVRHANWPADSKQTLTSWAQSMAPKMGRLLGKRYNEQELLVKLGLAQPAAAAATVRMDAPMVDIADLLKT